MLAVILQFHNGMQACVRLDDRECSDTFDVGQGLRKGRVLAPLLFNMIFTVLRVAEKRFRVDAAITGNVVQLQNKKGERREKGHFTHRQSRRAGGEGGGGGAEIVGCAARGRCRHRVVVSRSSERLERMMTVIVTACKAFGPTVSEAKTEITCVQIKGRGKVSSTTNAAG